MSGAQVQGKPTAVARVVEARALPDIVWAHILGFLRHTRDVAAAERTCTWWRDLLLRAPRDAPLRSDGAPCAFWSRRWAAVLSELNGTALPGKESDGRVRELPNPDIPADVEERLPGLGVVLYRHDNLDVFGVRDWTCPRRTIAVAQLHPCRATLHKAALRAYTTRYYDDVLAPLVRSSRNLLSLDSVQRDIFDVFRSLCDPRSGRAHPLISQLVLKGGM
jgi:hypothetical protein